MSDIAKPSNDRELMLVMSQKLDSVINNQSKLETLLTTNYVPRGELDLKMKKIDEDIVKLTNRVAGVDKDIRSFVWKAFSLIGSILATAVAGITTYINSM